MSHFCVAVFTEEGQDMDELLEPFCVENDVAPYIWMTKEEVIQKVKDRIAAFEMSFYQEYKESPEEFIKIHSHYKKLLHSVQNEFEKELEWSDEQCYQYGVELYEPEGIDENKNFLTTYNPNAKWDRYEVGGCWDNLLKVENGGLTQRCNSANVRDVEFPNNFTTFAVLLPDGTWKEQGDMHSFGIVENEEADWDYNYKKMFIEKADPDWQITIVDCHI